MMYVGIIFLVALSLGILSLKLFFDNLRIESQIASIEDYINDPMVVRKLNEISTMQTNIKQLDELNTEVASIIDVLDYTPRFDNEILKILLDNLPEGINITLVTYLDSWIRLEISDQFASDPSNYALRLQRTKFFKDVVFEGYKYDASSRRYIGIVKVQMKRGN